MTPQPHSRFDRRSLLRGGMTLGAAGALGLTGAGLANAGPAGSAAPAGNASRARLAAAPEPRVYTTAEWGARPPSSPSVILNHVPTYIVVHHTASPGNSTDYSLEYAMKICRDIQNFHMDGNGWSDSGQQFTNSRGGYVLEGRHESLGVVQGGTQHVQGANVGNHNSEIIGIENEGLYTEVDVPEALWDSLVGLVAWIAGQYGRPVENIMGHRDFNSTECPGEVLYGRLQELRDAVAGALGVRSVSPAVWPLLRPGDSGTQVRAAQHLLRAKGFRDVPADGVFGTTTKRAVAKLADTHGIEAHTCSALHHSKADETGYLGSDLWPLITPARATAGADAEVADALQSLRGANRAGEELSTRDWKRLLA